MQSRPKCIGPVQTLKLKPRLTVATVLNIIYVFNSFPIVWTITKGDPASRTDTLVTYLYKLAFYNGKQGEAAAVSVIAMLCGIPAAYALLARMKFKGQTAFLGFIIVSQMFAPVVLLIGIYKVMQILNLTNSILGLIFINAAFNQAFTIWLLRGTFMSISAEMEQAASPQAA